MHTIAVCSIINGSEQSAVLFSFHACVSGSLSLIKAQTAALELFTTALSLALYIQPDITTFSRGSTCSDDWSRLTWKDVFPAQSLNTGASSRWLKVMRYCSSVCKIMQYASRVLIEFHTALLLPTVSQEKLLLEIHFAQRLLREKKSIKINRVKLNNTMHTLSLYYYNFK